MLHDLHIRNLAVLEAAAIEFGPGFNVLSGETGAGKSIVVDSLSLLAGGRASSELIRTGAEGLVVTGVLQPDGDTWRQILSAAGIAVEGDELVIRREISRSGRNRVFVNDQPVTLKLLSELAPLLLRIHGQREELGLVAPELQRTWLDRCGGAEAERLLRRVEECYSQVQTLLDRLARLSGDERLRQQRIDLLRYQLNEIDAAGLKLGEEEVLRREREVLRHSEIIQQALAQAAESLFDREAAAYSELARAGQGLRAIERFDPQVRDWVIELDEIRVRLGELATPIRRHFEQIEADPARLAEIEDRLSTLERLFRKYGTNSEAVLRERQSFATELSEIVGDATSQDELQTTVEQALVDYRDAALALRSARQRWALGLAQGVKREMRDLALGNARFEVHLELRRRDTSPLQIDGLAVDFAEHGVDSVSYFFSPNPGEELRPLAKVASGGELSRLYLAVQLAVQSHAQHGFPVTLVFDEVDSGISGAEAALLGSKLKRLAQGGQVLAVTHLPQVASQADLHFKVSKRVHKGRTHTEIASLAAEARVEEVARMLAGSEVTALSLSHARELIAGVGA